MSGIENATRAARAHAGLAAFALIAVYSLVAPLFLPRGVFGWGHYRIVDLILGLPSVLLAVLLLPTCFRWPVRSRVLAHKLVLGAFSALFAMCAFDAMYLVVVRNVWREGSPTDVWFDDVGVTRASNRPHPSLGFTRKPHLLWMGTGQEGMEVVYRTDENGFRNVSHRGKAELLFLGDSFTEAASVPEELSYVDRTSHALDRTAVNLGRGAYGPQQEWMILEELGPRYAPEVVIWQLFEGNDLTDAERYARWKREQPLEPLKLRITKASLLVRLLGLTRSSGWMTPRPLRQTDGQVSRIYLDYPALQDQAQRYAEGFAETLVSLERGFAWAESAGAAMVVLFIPVKVRVLGPHVVFRDDQDRERWFPAARHEPSDWGKALNEIAEERGWPFLDMTRPLQQRANVDPRGLYAPDKDSHLGVRGHEVVAHELTRWIRNQTQDETRNLSSDDLLP